MRITRETVARGVLVTAIVLITSISGFAQPQPQSQPPEDASRAGATAQPTAEQPEPVPNERRVYRRGGTRVSVGKDMYVGPSDVIEDAVVSIAGSLRIDGRVEGEAIAVGGNVVLGPSAVVTGDVVTVAGKLEVAPGARLLGRASEMLVTWPEFAVSVPGLGDYSMRLLARTEWPAWLALAATLGRLSVTLLLGALLVLVGPETIRRIGAEAAGAPGMSFAAGLLTHVFFVPALFFCGVVLAVSVIGLPLVPLVFLAGFVVFVVSIAGLAGVLTRCGRIVSDQTFGAFTLAACFYGVMSILPFVAWIWTGRLTGVTFALLFAMSVIEAIAWWLGTGAALRLATRRVNANTDSSVTSVPPAHALHADL